MRRSPEPVTVQVIETKDHTVVLVITQDSKAGLSAEGLKNIVLQVCNPVPVTRGRGEDYRFFRQKFALPDDDRTLHGYLTLKETLVTSSEANLSTHLLNRLEDKEMATLLSPCFLTLKELLSIHSFGKHTLNELETKASEISGLTLKWH